MLNKTYHWYSKTTGEIVVNFHDVVKTFFSDLMRHHFLNIRWNYSKKGY